MRLCSLSSHVGRRAQVGQCSASSSRKLPIASLPVPSHKQCSRSAHSMEGRQPDEFQMAQSGPVPWRRKRMCHAADIFRRKNINRTCVWKGTGAGSFLHVCLVVKLQVGEVKPGLVRRASKTPSAYLATDVIRGFCCLRVMAGFFQPLTPPFPITFPTGVVQCVPHDGVRCAVVEFPAACMCNTCSAHTRIFVVHPHAHAPLIKHDCMQTDLKKKETCMPPPMMQLHTCPCKPTIQPHAPRTHDAIPHVPRSCPCRRVSSQGALARLGASSCEHRCRRTRKNAPPSWRSCACIRKYGLHAQFSHGIPTGK